MIVKSKFTKSQLVPPVEEIAREMTGSSQVAIIARRALKLSPVQLVRLGVNNLPYLPQLVRKDFATGVRLLCELTIVRTKRKEWILHSQMTDMAVALGNRQLIRGFLSLVKRYGFNPGLATNNPQQLLILLADIPLLPPTLVIYTNKARMSRTLVAFAKMSPLKFGLGH